MNLDVATAQLDSFDLDQRIRAIDTVAGTGGKDAARWLLEAFDRCGWRDTRRYLLFRLAPFLRDDRVFYHLAPLVDPRRDLQESVWILNAFKYAGTRRYDPFLVNVHRNATHAVVRGQALEALVHLRSPRCHTEMEARLVELGVPMESLTGDDGAFAVEPLLDEADTTFLLAFVHYLGRFRRTRYRPLLWRLCRSDRPELAEAAYLGLLQTSDGERPHDRYQLRLFQMETGTTLRDELYALHREARRLRRSDSLDRQLDLLFRQDPELVDPVAVEAVAEHPATEVLEYLTLYDEPRHWPIRMAVVAAVDAPLDERLEHAERHLLRHGRPIDYAVVANALWSRSSRDSEPVFTWVLGQIARLEPEGRMRCLSELVLPRSAAPMYATLRERLLAEETSSKERIGILNLLSREYHLAYENRMRQSTIERIFDVALEVVANPPSAIDRSTGHRLLRACGEIRYGARSLVDAYAALSDAEDVSEAEHNGLLRTAASLPVRAARKLLDRRVPRAYGDPRHALSEAGEAVLWRALFRSRWKLPDASVETVLAGVRRANLALVLEYLATHPSPRAADWLLGWTEQHGALSYLEKKWLIKALTEIADDRAVDWLEHQSRGPEPTLRTLAVYALTRVGSDRAVRSLVGRMAEIAAEPGQEALVAQAYRCLPLPNGGAEALAPLVDRTLDLCRGVEAYDALVSYRARLAGLEPMTGGAGSGATPELAALERRLVAEVPPLASSSTLRSVWLNADMPVAHPELYDRSVDKSTSILQYIKAIDIHLEELLGPRLADTHARERMEARVLELGLERLDGDPSLVDGLRRRTTAARILEQLGLSGRIPPESLPIGKLQKLVSAVLRGRLQDGRLRAIDGLKAWGIVLLLFAHRRPGEPDAPLVEPLTSVPVDLADVAARLFDLQDYRNPIAHRHTVLELVPIEKVRRRAVDLLVDVHALFGRPASNGAVAVEAGQRSAADGRAASPR